MAVPEETMLILLAQTAAALEVSRLGGEEQEAQLGQTMVQRERP